MFGWVPKLRVIWSHQRVWLAKEIIAGGALQATGGIRWQPGAPRNIVRAR